jgi:hypothetical protein
MGAVKQSFLAQYPHVVGGNALETMRICPIAGARTLCHTDADRGNTKNYMLCQGDGCGLRVYNFPEFHCCVVTLNGIPYIPIGYSERNQSLRMYRSNPNDQRKAQKLEFKGMSKYLTELHPVGRLPFVVVGIKGGLLQIDDSPSVPYQTDTISTPRDYPLVDFRAALAMANLPENAMARPFHDSRLVGKPHEWVDFEAWKFRHEFEGWNPNCPRTHVFFRLLRQLPTAENYIGKGKQNFVAITAEEVKHGPLDHKFVSDNVLFNFKLCKGP